MATRPAPAPTDATPPPIPPALRPWLERLRAGAIAEANELSRMLGLPTVRQEGRDERRRGGKG